MFTGWVVREKMYHLEKMNREKLAQLRRQCILQGKEENFTDRAYIYYVFSFAFFHLFFHIFTLFWGEYFIFDLRLFFKSVIS